MHCFICNRLKCAYVVESEAKGHVHLCYTSKTDVEIGISNVNV